MNEKKPKQLWPQTPLQWLGVLVLVFLASSVMGAIFNQFNDPFPEYTAATEKSQRALEELRRVMDEDDKNPQAIAASPQSQPIDRGNLILGKWKYWGTLEYGEDQQLGLTMEFASDGTYNRVRQYEYSTIAGNYQLSSDGQLITTGDLCEKGQCQPVTETEIASFPNPNTMYLKSDGDGVIRVFNRE